MPLLPIKHLTSNCQLAIWDIKESEACLLKMLHDAQIDASDIQSGNESHRKQKIAIKLILNKLNGFKQHFYYDTDGKPHLSNNSNHHISVSHSYDKAVLLFSKDQTVGVDIELIKEKIHKIQHRFLKDCEIPTTISTEHLYVSWCAKEALYKYFGKKKVSLKNDILLHPFHYQENGSILNADIIPASLLNLKVNYERIGAYMLAYIY